MSAIARSVGSRPVYAQTYPATPGADRMSYGERSDTSTVGFTAWRAFASVACCGYEKRSAEPRTTTSAPRADVTARSISGCVAERVIVFAVTLGTRRALPA